MIPVVLDASVVAAACGWTSAEFIITRDPDLLELEKPFGIQIVTPRSFLSRLQAGL